jgi:iron complex transport system substrate-binding protein
MIDLVKAVRIFGLIWLALLLSIPAMAQDKTRGRVITDMAGRPVTINGPVNRLVTTYKPATLCVFCLGLQNKLVGVDTDSKKDRLHQAVYPGVAGVPAVGKKSAGLNLETILSVKPDLVILYAQKDGRALADRLQHLGIPSIIIVPETFDSIKQALEIITRAVGDDERLIPAASRMDEVLDLVKEKLAGPVIEKKKRVYYASPRGLFSTTSGNMLQDEILARAGLVNVSHDLSGYFQEVSPEQLIRWKPDVMVLSQSLGSGLVERLDSPVFQGVPAVADRAVYRFPSTLSPWDFPSPLSVLATLWLAAKAYPDHFDQGQTMKMINQFHRDLFGQSLSDMGGELADNILGRQ